MGERDILPATRALAQSAKPIPLRLSALAALGQVGTEADVPLLEGIAAGPDG